MPSSQRCQSLAVLKLTAKQYGYETVALKLTQGEIMGIPLSAVVHLNLGDSENRGHYWVVEKIQDGLITLFDHQGRMRFSHSSDELENEWKCYAIHQSNSRNFHRENYRKRFYYVFMDIVLLINRLGGQKNGSY